jgi:hypothetical protein
MQNYNFEVEKNGNFFDITAISFELKPSDSLAAEAVIGIRWIGNMKPDRDSFKNEAA